jgi:hypothetical protein
MSTPIERRLSKLEEIWDRNGVGSDVDMSLARMGTSRAEMLADFGSLSAFRDWLAARIAGTDHPSGVATSSNYRQWQGDGAVSAKWDAILDRHAALQTAAPGACFSSPKEVQ